MALELASRELPSPSKKARLSFSSPQNGRGKSRLGRDAEQLFSELLNPFSPTTAGEEGLEQKSDSREAPVVSGSSSEEEGGVASDSGLDSEQAMEESPKLALQLSRPSEPESRRASAAVSTAFRPSVQRYLVCYLAVSSSTVFGQYVCRLKNKLIGTFQSYFSNSH